MCGWVWAGFDWICDGTCVCPEEETCLQPVGGGATGDRKTTPCLPAGGVAE